MTPSVTIVLEALGNGNSSNGGYLQRLNDSIPISGSAQAPLGEEAGATGLARFDS
jgi:hypothetical protein